MALKKLDPPRNEVDAKRRSITEKYDASFGEQVDALRMQALTWMVLVEAKFAPSAKHDGAPHTLLEARGSLLLKGLIISHRLSVLMHTLMSLHLSMALPFPKRVLKPLAACAELLKSIESTLTRRASVIGEALPHILRIMCGQLLALLRPHRTKLEASRRFDDHKLDILAALHVVECLLHGSDTLSFSRRTVLSLSVCLLTNNTTMKDEEADLTVKLLDRMGLLAEWMPLVRAACDCSFFLWSRELLPALITQIYEGPPTEAARLQYLLAAASDATPFLLAAAADDPQDEPAGENGAAASAAKPQQRHLRAFQQYVLAALEENLVKPLRTAVENDLRLRIHKKNLEFMSTPNPKKEAARQLRPFLGLKPLRVFGELFDVKAKVTRYLERVFYSLTTVALHDWLTYADMRDLAFEKYGLEIADNHLPMGSLDQGLDVLRIMQNIHIFVARFSYNLNQQNFVERRPDRGSKNVRTISIQSIAASLRQHGLGILNTTVNFTYQFLAQKFHVFNQFLYDDYIRSHLSKERRWFRKHKDECDSMFPHERALAFVKDIRKLGVAENGRTFLDQFRALITEIGNALGYVRMVRSAGMHFCAEAVRFLPELEHVVNFERHAGSGAPPEAAATEADEADKGGVTFAEHVDTAGAGAGGAAAATASGEEGAGLSEETVRAARNLDNVIDTLTKNFSEGRDYFHVLVNVFKTVLLSGEHSHLDNFYIIVPALCISWVESSLIAKDLMYKQQAHRTREAYYADDGFAVGIAYVLAILQQGSRFDSLHWFKCMSEKMRSEQAELLKRQREQEAKMAARLEKRKAKASTFSMSSYFGGGSSKDKAAAEHDDDDYEENEQAATLQLTAKRLQAYKRESELLWFSMSGARMFFAPRAEK